MVIFDLFKYFSLITLCNSN